MTHHEDEAAAVIRDRGRELAALRAEHGHAYYLDWQSGQFFAVRKDDGSVCRRPEAAALSQELCRDLAARPVLLTW